MFQPGILIVVNNSDGQHIVLRNYFSIDPLDALFLARSTDFPLAYAGNIDLIGMKESYQVTSVSLEDFTIYHVSATAEMWYAINLDRQYVIGLANMV